jgi:hypothetical protein
MATPTEERLQELLDIRDAELAAAQEENDRLRHQLEFGVDWMLHQHVPVEENVLPVPRIEMHIIEAGTCHVESQVTLVLPMWRDGKLARVPLAYSKRSGAALDIERYPRTGELAERLVGELPNLVNEACFLMEKTGIGAYVVLDEERAYRITSLRPLRLAAAPQAAA